ncbi:MAG: ABC transporter permease subunit [Alphaproteobacteria bacterium]|nr:ABC transporter permease subunit [Alphaproteobacteria bacterium]
MNKRYWISRICLIPITLLGILLINFVIIQMTPGGPIERMMLKMQSAQIAGHNMFAQGATVHTAQSSHDHAVTVNQDIKDELVKAFGFDKPAYVRFGQMVWNYIRFDFGKSFYQDKSVLTLIKEKMPVSISLGVFSTLFIYLLAIPLGIKKAVKNGTKFDKITTFGLTVGYAVPPFLLAIFFILFFAGGSYFSLFPLKGLTSDNFNELSFGYQILDYLWHLVLPVLSLSIGGLAGLCFLTKNSFLEEFGKAYVRTAKAKGASTTRILYGHVFRNAMLLVLAGFPALLIGMLFTGSVLIEIVFSLDGLGLLGYEAIQNRDYPVIFGTLYLFSLLGLVLNLLSDFIYTLIDPRIHMKGQTS